MSIADWRIEYDGAGGFPGAVLDFGSYASGLGFTKMPVLDAASLRDDDTDVPRGDGSVFGQDFRGSRPITFEMEAMADGDTLEERERNVTALVDTFMDVWDGDAVAKVGGAVAALTSHTGRTAYGRPRNPVADTTRSFQGRSSVTAEFETLNNLWYGEEQQEEVGLVAAASGGVVFPVVFPVVFGTPTRGSRSKIVRVGGSARARTGFVVRIQGPILNPIVELGPLRWAFQTQLAYDEWIEIDTRPWRRTILRNGTAGIATTGTSSGLLDSLLSPGQYELVLRGTAPTGNPTARATWRDPHKHW